MILDHFIYVLGPTIFIFYNGKGDLWVSAAEGFVGIAGFMVGYIYVRSLKKTFKEVLAKLLKRTFILYICAVALTLFFSLLFWDSVFPQSGILKDVTNPSVVEILVASFTFQHHYGWTELLGLYVYLLAVSPLIVWLLRKNQYILVAIGSLTLWAVSFLQIIPALSISYANVLAWQVLFVFGIIVGAKYEKFLEIWEKIRKNKWVFWGLAGVWLATIIGSIIYPQLYIGSLMLFDKGNIGIGRLLFVPIWIFGYWLIATYIIKKLPKFVEGSYALLGRNSLFVYSVHSIVIGAGTVFGGDFGLAMNSLISVVGLVLIVLVTWGLERVKGVK